MIKRLSKKFILISLFAVGIVLYLTLGITNALNLYRVRDNANAVIEILKEYKGKFPPNIESELPNTGIFYPITEETPYETRYFSVILDDDGNAIFADTAKISSIDEEEAFDLAETLYTENKTDGFYESLRYSTLVSDEGTMYIFVDFSKSFDVVANFAIYSFLISIGGMVGFFILLFFLSKVMIKPVKDSYIKQKSFITNASHDIKTPLTIISADTEIIEMEYGESEWTNDVKKQISRLADLTNKLVFLSKIDEDEYVMSKTNFDISKTLNDSIEPYESLSVTKGINFNYEIDENIMIEANQDMIGQMFNLLLDNALKYALSKISISLKRNGKQVEICFENDVEQIEKGEHNKIFERFYRLDSSRNSSTGGHGIGLSVVKAIVDTHKGKITCKSENTQSIKFTIIL